MKDRKLRTLIYIIVILSGIIFYLIPSGLQMNPQIFYNIGTSLTTSGIIALIFEISLKNEFIKNIKSELNSNIKIIGIGSELKRYYKNEFEKAKNEIDIIAISLTHGIDCYDEEFLNKIKNNHCRIRILIIDPESDYIEHRALDEPDNQSERIVNKIKLSISYFKLMEKNGKMEFSKEKPLGSIQVKTHKSIPYFVLSRFDNKCLYTPLLIGRYGNHTPVIEIEDRNSEIFNNLKSHFDNLWAREENNEIINIDYGYLP